MLIDYCHSKLEILSLLSKEIARVHVARATFNKVKDLSESKAKRFHLFIETPELEIANTAVQNRGVLAYDDWETLLLARSYNWTCITNDKRLRQECKKVGVHCLWGLEPMKALVERRIIPGSVAKNVASLINNHNPYYIDKKILKRFEQQIREIEEKLRRSSS